MTASVANTLAGRVMLGACAGFIATAPMTVVMSLWHRRLSWWERDPLPPRKITNEMLETLDLRDDLSEQETQALTMVSHFGYGAAMGGIFGLIPPARTALGSAAAGMAYGVGVWSGSYLGWLPAVGLHRSATREPQSRNLLMFSAHLVWGGSLGLVAHWLSTRSTSRDNLPVAEPPQEDNCTLEVQHKRARIGAPADL